MRQRLPLAVKLGAAFFMTIVLSVVIVYFLTESSVTHRFSDYQAQKRTEFFETLASLLTWYWQQNDSWVGTYEFLYNPVMVRLNDQVYSGYAPIYEERFSLANENGRVFISTERENIARDLTQEELDRGVAIRVDGVRVGTLLPADVGSTLDPDEAAFLSSARRSAMIGGGIAAVFALTLALFLISQILSPLRKLSTATERIAKGDLPEKVRLRSRDEIGQLGDSFNHMIDNLRRSETLRRTMTADIAHEIRTPVTIIQGTLEAVLDGVYEPTAETIAPIYEETLHLGRLIDDLRDLALAEAGELRLEKEAVDVGQLARQVTEAAVPPLEDAPIVRVNVDEDVPIASIDPKRFRQVIANLLSNAVRYTPSDGAIDIDIRAEGDQIEVGISDTGPGVSTEDLPHLFERFYRGDPARNRTGGSGLGLAIAKQWVEAHGGRIWAENRPTGGAKFTFRVPLA
jgi:two-component system sensor histidine kinase BaeS